MKDADLKTSVYEHFQKWGQIMSVKVFKDWLKRPYAFVQYEVHIHTHTHAYVIYQVESH